MFLVNDFKSWNGENFITIGSFTENEIVMVKWELVLNFRLTIRLSCNARGWWGQDNIAGLGWGVHKLVHANISPEHGLDSPSDWQQKFQQLAYMNSLVNNVM